MGVEVNMSVYSTLYLVPSKKRLQVNALLQHGKKVEKVSKFVKRRCFGFVLLSKIMMFSTQCLKITPKVSFNITSKASYMYILSE